MYILLIQNYIYLILEIFLLIPMEFFQKSPAKVQSLAWIIKYGHSESPQSPFFVRIHLPEA
jgi:hypothetical protein